MQAAIVAGYFSGLSLIAAIGAQNAFVLRQGLRREHVLAVVLACALSDALLIAAGVLGFGRAAELAPWLGRAMLWGGIAFLVVYGAGRFRAALRGGAALRPEPGVSASLAATLATCLTLTWANPHVYLDTLVLLGALSAQHAPYGAAFGLGAGLASFSFFAALGYGARLLAPVFARPQAWVVLELVVGATMWVLAILLALG